MPKQRRRPRGGQPANTNAKTHGLYAAPARKLESIEDVVGDVQARQQELSTFIQQHLSGGQASLDDVIRLFALHAQNASRLGRLLRDQRALSGASADGMAAALATALDELSTELGVAL